MVEVEGGVAAVAWLAEGVRPIGMRGNRAVGAAEVWRHHLLGWRERWTQYMGRRGGGVLIAVNAIVGSLLTSHPYNAGPEYAGFSTD